MATRFTHGYCPGGEECRHWGRVREYGTPNVHVYPYNDEVMHITDSRCICGPRWEAVRRDRPDLDVVWLYIHASADGREAHE